MDQSIDRRTWSTTPEHLYRLVGTLLEMGIAPTSVRDLQRIFKQYHIYPARDFPQFCTSDPPDAFFSYHSVQGFVEIQEIVWRASSHAARQLSRSHPELTEDQLKFLISDGFRLWVDFMFIDQSARDLREELGVLPRLLRNASMHFVLGTQPLMRAWCCYEIALFNQRFTPTENPRLPGIQRPGLRSFIAPTRSFYIGWEQTETSEVDDKTFIAESIAASFPGGFDGFNDIMAQANSVAVGSLTESAWSTVAADENLEHAVEAWYKRTFPDDAASR